MKEEISSSFFSYHGKDSSFPIVLIRDIAFDQLDSWKARLVVTSPISIRLPIHPLDSFITFSQILFQSLPRLYINLRPVGNINTKRFTSPTKRIVFMHTIMINLKLFERRNVLPTPKGPIREDDIITRLVSTVVKQWRGDRRIWSAVAAFG